MWQILRVVSARFSRFAKPHDVIVLPYTRVQIAHARYVHALALLLAVRDKMAADFFADVREATRALCLLLTNAC